MRNLEASSRDVGQGELRRNPIRRVADSFVALLGLFVWWNADDDEWFDVGRESKSERPIQLGLSGSANNYATEGAETDRDT